MSRSGILAFDLKAMAKAITPKTGRDLSGDQVIRRAAAFGARQFDVFSRGGSGWRAGVLDERTSIMR